MIFYFTGTGNSLVAAGRLAESGERLVDMAAPREKREFRYEIGKGEKVGFVFPVYWYTVGDVVMDFVRQLELSGARYVYAVITCGGGIGFAGAVLNRELKKRGIRLHCVYPLLMPDDAVFYYDIGPEEKIGKRLSDSEVKIGNIWEEISCKRIRRRGFSLWFIGYLMRFLYHRAIGTRKFWVTDRCTGCGRCARKCPDHAIEMKNGKPVWTKKKCTKCSGCINCCPFLAIEYGKGTEGRIRYHHPEY